MAYPESNFDMNDFVNLDQDFHSPTSSTSPTLSKQESRSAESKGAMNPPDRSEQQRHYAGPSHDYGQFKQQTGLPTGSIQHVGAVDDFSRVSNFNGIVRPTVFGAAHFGAGYNSGVNLDDFDNGSPSGMPTYFYPGDAAGDDLIDPNAVDSVPQPSNAVRAWPGMHSQQAQQAKALAIAQEQRQRQHQRQQLMMQQQLPGDFEQSVKNTGHSRNGSGSQMNDQISRLLNQMRNGSDGSVGQDDVASKMNDIQHIARMRKDEEDMDEDERLLASEEGKKLSSKERRQLRNKVSARAFRSRRKGMPDPFSHSTQANSDIRLEYIGQLEGEVASRTAEANELKSKNRELMEQNSQLTQLTRAMLGHPSFQTFMQECSNDPSILHNAQNQRDQPASNSQEESQSQGSVKQEQSSHSDESTHVGFASVPENNLNFSMLNLGNNHWDAGHAGFNFQQPQVFSVFEVPCPDPEEFLAAPLRGKQEPTSVSFESTSALFKGSINPKSQSKSQSVALPATKETDLPASVQFNPVGNSPSPTPLQDHPPFSQSRMSMSQASDCPESFELSETSVPFDLDIELSCPKDAAVRKVERMFASLDSTRRRIEAVSASILSQ